MDELEPFSVFSPKVCWWSIYFVDATNHSEARARFLSPEIENRCNLCHERFPAAEMDILKPNSGKIKNRI